MSDFKACNSKHDLVIISEISDGTPGVTEVVRWCKNCGAIVIDADVDGRTYPGDIMKMAFPRIVKSK